MREAAIRELHEETSICADFMAYPSDVIDIIGHGQKTKAGARPSEDNAPTAPEHHFVLAVFFANYSKGAVKAGDDAQDAAWLEHAQLRQLRLTPQSEQLIDKLVQARAHEGLNPFSPLF